MKKTKEVTLTIHNFESFPLDIDYPLKNREYRKKRKNTDTSDEIAENWLSIFNLPTGRYLHFLKNRNL